MYWVLYWDMAVLAVLWRFFHLLVEVFMAKGAWRLLKNTCIFTLWSSCARNYI